MPTPVVMPQMGESIAEGTIVRWIKHVGDAVERDEPLFEISTDKVDAEIPAPTAGILSEITVQEGQTVPVNSVVAMIRQDTEAGDLVASAGPAQDEAGQPPGADASWADQSAPVQSPARAAGRGREARISPVVRRLAREHQIDLARIGGTGSGGRVTKRDLLAVLDGGTAGARGAFPGADVEVEPMSVMRRKIAEHMVRSRQTSAHAHSVFEVDFTRVAELREAHKQKYERQGTKPTYLSFVARAVVDAAREVPIVNSSLDGDKIVYKRAINLGIAVALDWGLIVPVVHRAEGKTLVELSQAIADLAARARTKLLTPEEVQGGTFTITNQGVSGALFGMPIINQPQVAILGVGAVQKRPAVVDEALAIRLMAYLTLGFDHRVIDGATADLFMSKVKARLENFPDESA